MSTPAAPTVEPAAGDRPESAVRDRYAAAANAREASLCCPVDYEPRWLEAIPEEVLERDYGCGDPSRHVRPGDRVLDLGSGGGKICFIAAQIAGPEGSVVGIDMTDDMLSLARSAAPVVAERVGFSNVEFRRGRIQDLGLDEEALAAWLRHHPVHTLADLEALEAEKARLRRESPLVADGSIDVVVSNCVLNLVSTEDRAQMVDEIFRVLAVGGRVALSDIVSDEVVPEALRADPELWSGCISGAFQERELLAELERAGFHGLRIDQWSQEPFAVVDGIEFRSVTVTAVKPAPGPCLEAHHTLVHAGPWKRVEDDDGHVFERGVRTAVCAKTFEALSSGPWAESMIAIEPHDAVPPEDRAPFDCARTSPRHPRESKGERYRLTRTPGARTPGEDGCC